VPPLAPTLAPTLAPAPFVQPWRAVYDLVLSGSYPLQQLIDAIVAAFHLALWQFTVAIRRTRDTGAEVALLAANETSLAAVSASFETAAKSGAIGNVEVSCVRQTAYGFVSSAPDRVRTAAICTVVVLACALLL
jgi:hypothetical protein